MTIKAHVMSTGSSWPNAGAITGGVVTQAVSGSSSTDATLMTIASHIDVSTSSSNQGMIFPPGNGSTDGLAAGDWGTISNSTGNTIKVYPPKGYKINSGTQDAAVSMTTHQNALWRCTDGNNYIMIVV